MDKKEMIQMLIHKRMEARARLEFFKMASPVKYQKVLNELLDRINEIDRILQELEKNK